MLNRSRSHDPHQDSSYPSIILVQKKEYWYKVDNFYRLSLKKQNLLDKSKGEEKVV